jgi:uncharacterized Zn finger protein
MRERIDNGWGEIMMYADLVCPFCHTDDFEVTRNDTHGFIVLCNECGYARGATLQHLLAG